MPAHASLARCGATTSIWMIPRHGVSRIAKLAICDPSSGRVPSFLLLRLLLLLLLFPLFLEVLVCLRNNDGGRTGVYGAARAFFMSYPALSSPARSADASTGVRATCCAPLHYGRFGSIPVWLRSKNQGDEMRRYTKATRCFLVLLWGGRERGWEQGSHVFLFCFVLLGGRQGGYCTFYILHYYHSIHNAQAARRPLITPLKWPACHMACRLGTYVGRYLFSLCGWLVGDEYLRQTHSFSCNAWSIQTHGRNSTTKKATGMD